jgi:hypothetical protein
MGEMRMPKSTTTAKRAKRPSKAAKRSPRRKSKALPAKRPGPFDVIADRFEIDHVDFAPTRKFGFSLHLGGDGHWSGNVGRMEMPQEKAVDSALRILGFADEWGNKFTPAQRERFAKFALGPVFEKRHDAVTARYNARDITLEQATHLGEEIRDQFDDAVHALVAAETQYPFEELTPVTCEYVADNEVCVWLKTKTGDTVTFPLSTDSMMALTNMLVAIVQTRTAQVIRDLRTPAAA